MTLENKPLAGKSVLAFIGDIYEDLELCYPRYRMIEAGASFVMVGQEAAGTKYLGKHGYPLVSDKSLDEVKSSDFAGLLVPGGFMPDKLRRDPKVLNLVREFATAGKCVAAICHGGWIPISAGVYRGVRVTGSPGIKDDLINAGAIWEDSEVVVDRNFICSRKPDDLPAFCREMIRMMAG